MEPPNFVYHATSAVALAVLIAFYFFGVWLRTYVMPAHDKPPLKRQLFAAVPVGFVTMGLYAKGAFMALSAATFVFDAIVMAGYAIIFGMLSRESLDRLLNAAQDKATPHA